MNLDEIRAKANAAALNMANVLTQLHQETGAGVKFENRDLWHESRFGGPCMVVTPMLIVNVEEGHSTVEIAIPIQVAAVVSKPD